jgi:hypothetical protein
MSLSALENVLAMPAQKDRMRRLFRTRGRQKPSIRIEQADDLLGNLSLREKKLVVVGDRDEAAIEHPVDRSAERDAVAQRIRARRHDGADMGRLDLATPAAG